MGAPNARHTDARAAASPDSVGPSRWLFLAASGARADEAREERFEKTYELSGIRKVSVQNVNGAVQIETGGDKLQVVAVKKVKRGSDSDLLKETEIRVTKTGSSSRSRRSSRSAGHFFPWFFFGRSSSADVAYQLTLPASLALEAETVNGRLAASKRTGRPRPVDGERRGPGGGPGRAAEGEHRQRLGRGLLR